MHQGSALSPLLFVIVMEALSREFRVALLWEFFYADDMVLDNGLLNALMVYAPFSGKIEEERELLEQIFPFGEL